MSLYLHETKGLNPKLTTCPRCGGDGPDLILLGARDYKDICQLCGAVYIGGADPKMKHRGCVFKRLDAQSKEVKCGGTSFSREPIEEHEKLPGGLCYACEEEIKQHREIVAAGGIHWRCVDCKSEGVIKAESECAKEVRAHMKIEPPDPVGLEFYKDPKRGPACPVCGPGGRDAT